LSIGKTRSATARERNEVKLPHTRGFIRDVVIAGGFIAIGILAPGSPIENGFEAHLGGISIGLGLGWLIKCFVDLKGSNDAKPS
jgi:membrane associated rhomboid family serine protease